MDEREIRFFYSTMTIPEELLLEIFSYVCPSLPIHPSSCLSQDELAARNDRRALLLALSRTTRTFRRICAPYLWEVLEVYPGMITPCGPGAVDATQPEHWSTEIEDIFPGMQAFSGPLGSPWDASGKYLALEVARQQGHVLRTNPHLADHVRMVDISLYDHDVKNVVQSLIEGLTLLPNVHTVKLSIICSHKWSPTLEMLVNSSRRICQSVDRVYLSPFLTCLHPLFPNARQLESFHGKALTSFLLSDVPSVNTSVEVLDCVDHSVWAAPDIGSKFPNVRDLALEVPPSITGLTRLPTILRKFTRLQTLRLRRRVYKTHHGNDRAPVAFMCELGIEALSALQATDGLPKRLIVVGHDGSEEVTTLTASG